MLKKKSLWEGLKDRIKTQPKLLFHTGLLREPGFIFTGAASCWGHQSHQCFCLAVYQYVSSPFSSSQAPSPVLCPLQFPFPNPISRSSFSIQSNFFTHPPNLLDHHHRHHSPRSFYSVADIFPASLDKNKFCCFVWCCAKAFVSVTSFCLGNSSLFSVTVKAHMQLKGLQGVGNVGERRNKQEKMLCNAFFSLISMLTKTCTCVCVCVWSEHAWPPLSPLWGNTCGKQQWKCVRHHNTQTHTHSDKQILYVLCFGPLVWTLPFLYNSSIIHPLWTFVLCRLSFCPLIQRVVNVRLTEERRAFFLSTFNPQGSLVYWSCSRCRR